MTSHGFYKYCRVYDVYIDIKLFSLKKARVVGGTYKAEFPFNTEDVSHHYYFLFQIIDTVPLEDTSPELFEPFRPLYEVIPDMPRPPDSFFKTITGEWSSLTLSTQSCCILQ